MKNLALIRCARNLSRKELATRMNVSSQTIFHWESGLRTRVTPETLKRLAEVLQVSVDDLLSGKLTVSIASAEVADHA